MSLRTILFLIATHTCLATSSFGGLMVEVIPVPTPTPSLSAFKLRLIATEGNRVSTIRALSVVEVHQIWENPISDLPQTPHANDFGGSFADPSWADGDTHFLPLPRFNSSPGFAIQETNDGLNPNGFDLTPSHPLLTDYKGVAGKGTLRFVDTNNPAKDSEATIAFLAPQPQSVDLMQIVTPYDLGHVRIRFHAEDSSVNGQNFDLLVPSRFGGRSTHLGAMPYGSTIEFGTVQGSRLLDDAITLSNDKSNPFDISLLAATIIGPDAHLFEIIGFEAGTLAVGAQPIKYDVRFLGGEPSRTYEAQLQIEYKTHPIQPPALLRYTLRASVVPEPAACLLLSVGLLAAVGYGGRKRLSSLPMP